MQARYFTLSDGTTINEANIPDTLSKLTHEKIKLIDAIGYSPSPNGYLVNTYYHRAKDDLRLRYNRINQQIQDIKWFQGVFSVRAHGLKEQIENEYVLLFNGIAKHHSPSVVKFAGKQLTQLKIRHLARLPVMKTQLETFDFDNWINEALKWFDAVKQWKNEFELQDLYVCPADQCEAHPVLLDESEKMSKRLPAKPAAKPITELASSQPLPSVSMSMSNNSTLFNATQIASTAVIAAAGQLMQAAATDEKQDRFMTAPIEVDPRLLTLLAAASAAVVLGLLMVVYRACVSRPSQQGQFAMSYNRRITLEEKGADHGSKMNEDMPKYFKNC